MNPEPARVLSAQGQELLERLAGVEVTPDRALALSAALREEYPAELVAAALTQQALRVAGRAKFSRADEMLFTRSGLEQASSEVTSQHAAWRFAGARVVADLCCGIGGNLTALAAQQPDGERQRCGVPQAEESGKGRVAGGGASRGAGDGPEREVVIGVDSDPVNLEFARHNVSVYAPLAR